jgi:hypothetical protein
MGEKAEKSKHSSQKGLDKIKKGIVYYSEFI